MPLPSPQPRAFSDVAFLHHHCHPWHPEQVTFWLPLAEGIISALAVSCPCPQLQPSMRQSPDGNPCQRSDLSVYLPPGCCTAPRHLPLSSTMMSNSALPPLPGNMSKKLRALAGIFFCPGSKADLMMWVHACWTIQDSLAQRVPPASCSLHILTASSALFPLCLPTVALSLLPGPQQVRVEVVS